MSKKSTVTFVENKYILKITNVVHSVMRDYKQGFDLDREVRSKVLSAIIHYAEAWRRAGVD